MSKDIKVTGTPQEYGDGAIRNTKEGKGRFDLIPPEVFQSLFQHVNRLETYPVSGWRIIDCNPYRIIQNIAEDNPIEAIIKLTLYGYGDNELSSPSYRFDIGEFRNCCWDMFKDLAIHFQKGAEIYGEHNCEKGIPKWSFKDSAMRHATQYFNEEQDEPHLISAIWNLWMLKWTMLKEQYNHVYKYNTNEFNKGTLHANEAPTLYIPNNQQSYDDIYKLMERNAKIHGINFPPKKPDEDYSDEVFD